jgi:hypothetical protein
MMNPTRRPDDRIGRSSVSIARSEQVAPVVPTRDADVRLRPLGLLRSRIDGGLWADRRQTNHDLTIPHGAALLEEVGNLQNFRLAAGGAGRYRGAADDSGSQAPFLDSDVYKWLEAVGWELAQSPDEKLAALAEPAIELIGKAQLVRWLPGHILPGGPSRQGVHGPSVGP